ncbi:MAG: SDR family oxidoreductase, partial [Bacteroidia bacterium]
SIAWQVALKASKHGAELVLTNSPVAVRMGTISELAQITSSKVIVADATSMVDIDKLIAESIQIFGGRFDFILHSIGMSPNVRKDIPYENTSYDNMLKTFDISALSFHRILQTCYKYDAINEWGSVVALSYVAAQRTLTGYNDMGDAKALLESIARTFGYIYGRDRKVRINTISQSPTPTTAGSGVHGMESLLDFSERMSPLGNASAEECADYCVALFSDLTRKVTMQNLYHDGGFSSMGMSLKAIEQYKKSFEECDCDDK